MPNTVQKPDANPVVSALLTALIFNLGHYLINGQQRKWLFSLLAILIGYVLCCIPGVVIWVLSIIDSYQTAQRLQAGETIGENEYTNPTRHPPSRGTVMSSGRSAWATPTWACCSWRAACPTTRRRGAPTRPP